MANEVKNLSSMWKWSSNINSSTGSSKKDLADANIPGKI